ncbi:MAG: GIY-YIG nuclease family protein, partial [Verrucomicrobiae bacterium]|nr:GIY-YIG nuclease family protein [Verrucomicrobiae bacterium]
MSKEFFPPRPVSQPKIYAYRDTNPQYDGLLKVGYTTIDVRDRVAQQYPIVKPGPPPYSIVLEETAMRNDGTAFTDREVHAKLREWGVSNPGGEWFECDMPRVRAAVLALREGGSEAEDRSLNFVMRPEQAEAVAKTAEYFETFHKEEPHKTPHFL